MAKRIQTEEASGLGPRRAALRKAEGFTQVELAAEPGISQGMVAYYESPGAMPPATLLPAIATAFAVSIDALLGRPIKRKRVKQEGGQPFAPRFAGDREARCE